MKRALLLCIALCLCTASALAAPSIAALEDPKPVELPLEDLSDSLRAELEGDIIYTSRALTDQYDGEMYSIIALAERTFAETASNGNAIAQSIPSVQEIFADVQPEERAEDEGIDLSQLKQLTYMQDFKRESTGWRIVQDGEQQVLALTISGSEVVKSGKIEDFVIIQLNPETGRRVFLQMKAYDPVSGTFTVEFPSFGPYMITQIM